MRAGEVFTDSAGVTARYTPMQEIEEGEVVVSGWRPYLVVERVEIQGGHARMHFRGGHVGGWDERDALVPVALDRGRAQDD